MTTQPAAAPTLREISKAHRGKVSDKWSSYLDEYQRLFRELKDQPVSLLEIGVQNGGSLEIWAKYFANARYLTGCDINENCRKLKFDDPRIAVFVGDANSDAIQSAIVRRIAEFDIIIDDGSHKSGDIVKSFARYFPLLNRGGIFLAEDLHCSYWRDFEGGLFDPLSSIAFFKDLADVLNHEHWGIPEARAALLEPFTSAYGVDFSEQNLAEIQSVEFLNSVCIVRKKTDAETGLGFRCRSGLSADVFSPLDPFAGFGSTGVTPDQSANIWSRSALFEARTSAAGTAKEISDLSAENGRLTQEGEERQGQLAGVLYQLSEATQQIDKLKYAEKQIRKLEHSLWLVRSSKSYRLTYPLRKAEEVLRAAARLPGAICRYVSPGFRRSFDARLYLSSPARPHGWWRNFPAMHYCLFHENDREDHGKYGILDKAKPTVLLITHSACRTGAPILVLDLLNRFSKTHNTIALAIGGGALEETFRKKANVFVGPIARSNLGFVLHRELRLLKSIGTPSFAVVNSIEATEALDELWRNDVPTVHLIHEFATYTRPRARIAESAIKADAMVFSADIVRNNAIGTCAEIAGLEKLIMPQGICALPESPDSDEVKETERAAIRQAFRPKHLPQDTVVVLGAGTVQLRKGLHLFVSCAKKVREKDPSARIRFVWIGSGFNPEEDLNYSCFVDEQIKRSELGDSFTLLNEVHELQCAYDSADIFFLSSQLDPLPLVAQDALLNKLPLVCFDGASGITDCIKEDDEASAGIVPYLDIDAAAEKILRLAADSEFRKRTGDAGRRLAGRIFDQDKYFADLNRIGSKAAEAKKQEIIDRKVIQESGCFDVGFAYPRLTDEPDLALKYYTSSWRKGFFRRKPFPGFHPGVYADFHPDISCDPLAHFVRSGKPAGPWLLESISAENQEKVARFPSPPKAALHIHLHYPDVAGEIFSRLEGSGFQPDLFLSVTSEKSKREVQARLNNSGLKCAALRVVPNRGRDIGPLFTGFPEIFSSGYDFVGHVHGKKSVNLGSEFARQWAVFLFENLLGGKTPMMNVIIQRMQADPSLGLVFPDDPHVVGWEANWSFAKELGERMGLRESLQARSINFPVGTMFWARTRALEPFLKLNLQWEDYPQEPLPYDGSMLHAIERLLPVVCESQGLRIAVTHTKGIPR